MRRAFVALAPGLIVAVLSATMYWGVPGSLDWFAGTYGIVVYLAGMVLAWIFHRSRAFVILALVGWLDVFAVGAPGESPIEVYLGPFVVDAANRPSVLLLAGTAIVGLMALLALLRDRGVASRVGALQLLATASCVALAASVATNPEGLAVLATDPGIEALTRLTVVGIPRITVLAALVAVAALIYAIQRYRGPVERGMAWTVLFLLMAMHEAVALEHASIFLMAAGLAMTFAVIETSYVMAYRDELTGLPGRRALMQYLDGLQGTYALAMVDVDHFKKFNDRHGHDVGDQVLKLVASRLARVPGGGKAYRYGGEEFTLLFPGRTREEALPHLEAVRVAVEDARFTLRSWRRPRKKPETKSSKAKSSATKAKGKGKKDKVSRSPRKLSVTVSIGMADSTGSVSAAAAVLKQADRALYRAKKAGRNRVAK